MASASRFGTFQINRTRRKTTTAALPIRRQNGFTACLPSYPRAPSYLTTDSLRIGPREVGGPGVGDCVWIGWGGICEPRLNGKETPPPPCSVYAGAGARPGGGGWLVAPARGSGASAGLAVASGPCRLRPAASAQRAVGLPSARSRRSRLPLAGTPSAQWGVEGVSARTRRPLLLA